VVSALGILNSKHRPQFLLETLSGIILSKNLNVISWCFFSGNDVPLKWHESSVKLKVREVRRISDVFWGCLVHLTYSNSASFVSMLNVKKMISLL
jgi:hypothetical protein